MASKVDLANIALANIRAASINTFGESSVNAEYVSLFYPKVLESMFNLHNWGFIHAEKPLALLTDELFDWAYTYQYPADCLRLNYLKSPLNRVTTPTDGFAIRPEYDDNSLYHDLASRQIEIPHEVKIINGNRVIGANEPDLWIDYRVINDNPNTYTPLFVDAFTWQLGADLAIPIVGGDVGRSERKNATMIAKETLASAISEDIEEGKNRTLGMPKESDLILVRG